MKLLHRWPAALGLAAAAGQLALGPDTDTVTTVIAVAVLCYLGAAALNRRWVGWAGCLVFPAIVVAADLAGLTWWVIGALVALALVVLGLLLRSPRRALTAETAGLLGYGAVAVLALSLSPRTGLAVAGVALCAHAVWDVVHYRRDVVVNRSLAEFCVLLDVPLGIAAVILAITG
ncbi:hypothetical protein ACIA5D_07895 [Actinoplanes sp. NPDC051513]|uniref:hypothetical protein n=1 Tax=Actinoplanes sp. NPDC051513 TaxID=3363908 RepID=UPI0037A630EF